jgi:hypothetical protein
VKRWILGAALLVSSLAIAGKAEREYVKTDLTPAVTKAQDSFKKACGCALKINVNANLKEIDDMRQAKYISDNISDSAAGYCTDDASKKAMCVMKTLDITKGKETKFTYAGGKGTAITDGQSYVSWDMMTREIDK